MTREDVGNSSKARFVVQDKPRFKVKFRNHRSSTMPTVNKGKESTPNPKEYKGSTPFWEKSPCVKCCMKQEGKSLVGTENFYVCGKSVHIKSNCPMMKAQGR